MSEYMSDRMPGITRSKVVFLLLLLLLLVLLLLLRLLLVVVAVAAATELMFAFLWTLKIVK